MYATETAWEAEDRAKSIAEHTALLARVATERKQAAKRLKWRITAAALTFLTAAALCHFNLFGVVLFALPAALVVLAPMLALGVVALALVGLWLGSIHITAMGIVIVLLAAILLSLESGNPHR